jgi:bifunctional non-homologous end joining protein LigD
LSGQITVHLTASEKELKRGSKADARLRTENRWRASSRADDEGMAHCKDGLPDFHGLRSDEGGAAACLFAFDLLGLNGEDLRPLPLEERRACLRKALRGAGKALRYSEHLEGDGEAIFRHACELGLEGIVSKRRDSRYRSGRSLTWLKIKNPSYQRR